MDKVPEARTKEILMKKVLLYSGGMDSYIIKHLWKPDVCLHVCIGTKNEEQELSRLRHYAPDTIIEEIPLAKFEDKKRNFLLPCRNLFLVSMASYYGDVICLGSTDFSVLYDNSKRFCQSSERLLSYLWSESSDRKIKVVAPYRGVSKSELLRRFVEAGGDPIKCWQQSFSCYSPKKNGTPCWKCNSCLKKIKAFEDNGYRFSRH